MADRSQGRSATISLSTTNRRELNATMSNVSAETIRKAIENHPDPETGKPIGSMGQIKDVVVDGDQIVVTIGLSSHSAAITDEVADALVSKITAAAPDSKVSIKIDDHERPPARIGQIALRAIKSGKLPEL